LKSQKRTGFPIAAGVITIVASCISIIFGILGTTAFIALLDQRFFGMVHVVGYLVMGLLGLVAFALGLTGGILMLKRKRFGLAASGVSIVLASGIANIIVVGAQGAYAIASALVFGLPIVILAILGVVFTAVSKGEFT
jgi:hypothetical protein